MNSVKKQFFIVGTQRSGTTLLRLILNTHSQIAIPRESHFLMPFLRKKYLKRSISGSALRSFGNFLSSKSDFQSTYVDGHYNDFFSQFSHHEKLTLRELIDRIFSAYCRSEGKSIWGNKTPSFFRKIDILQTLFPDAKFIHIVRDGRDVFDSWRKMNPLNNNVAAVALDWRYKLSRIEKSFKNIPEENKITIRYEDLLENPEDTIKSVCSVIGIGYEKVMLDFYKTSHKHTIPHHSELIFKPLNKENTNKWKKNLLPREVKIFNMLAGHYLKKYNYEIEYNVPNVSDILFMMMSLLIGLPQRLIRIMQVKRILGSAVRKMDDNRIC